MDELLRRISSYEMTEWVAYEQAFGPLDSTWSDDMLASIHEQIQAMTLGLGGEEGQRVIRRPRPFELFSQYEAQQERDDGLTEEEKRAAEVAALNAALDGR